MYSEKTSSPFFERFFIFRRAQRVPAEKTLELGHNAINRRVRWDLNKNLFESKWLGFRCLLLEVSRLCFQRKTFKIENGTIAVKAVYQGDVKLTTSLYLLLSITFFLPKQTRRQSLYVIDSYYLTKGKKSRD
jgi:hypothetical protein